MIFINFKNKYEDDPGGIKVLMKEIASAQKKISVPIIPVVREAEAAVCRQEWDGELWLQQIGADYVEAVVDSPIKINGTFINHSDYKLSLEQINNLLEGCRTFFLKSLVFADNEGEFRMILQLSDNFGRPLKPDFIAYEPPELIGSRETSVAKARPEIISRVAEMAREAGVPLVVGAGIKDAADVRKSISLGAVGVAVSSAVLLAGNRKAKIVEMAGGF